MGRLASLLGQKKQMSVAQKLRHLTMAALAGLSLVTMAVSATIVAGALTPAVAQVSEEFEIALEPYGSWRPHPRGRRRIQRAASHAALIEINRDQSSIMSKSFFGVPHIGQTQSAGTSAQRVPGFRPSAGSPAASS